MKLYCLGRLHVARLDHPFSVDLVLVCIVITLTTCFHMVAGLARVVLDHSAMGFTPDLYMTIALLPFDHHVSTVSLEYVHLVIVAYVHYDTGSFISCTSLLNMAIYLDHLFTLMYMQSSLFMQLHFICLL